MNQHLYIPLPIGLLLWVGAQGGWGAGRQLGAEGRGGREGREGEGECRKNLISPLSVDPKNKDP